MNEASSRAATIVTAHTLLFAILEMQSMTPDLATWTEAKLTSNPPRLYRLQILMSMFRAFDLPWDPTSFVHGSFIDPDDPIRQSLLDDVAAAMPDRIRAESGLSLDQIPMAFRWLYDFRRHIGHVLEFPGCVYMASGLFAFALDRVSEVAAKLRTDAAGIDDLLAKMIDPKAKSFTMAELIESYGCPDVDLFGIDLDHL